MDEAQFRAELAKRDQQIASLTQQVQGLAAERNELREAARGGAPAAPAGGGYGGHPFSAVLDDPSAADQWLQKQVNDLFAKQGFVTNAQLGKLMEQAQTAAYQMMRGDALLWRNADGLMSREKVGPDGKTSRPFEALKQYDSDLSKSVAKILQEKGWGRPMHDQPTNFVTDWGYTDLKALEWAAELARIEQANAAPVAASAAATGAAAQAAAGLVSTPPSGGGAAPAAVQPRMKELIDANAEPAAVMAALDEAVETANK